MKAGKAILIIVIILIVLYVAYRYIYKDNKPKTLADFASPRDYHSYQVQQGITSAVTPVETNNESARVDYAALNNNLVTLLQALGYYVVIDETKNTVTAIGDSKNGNSTLVQKFAIKYPGTGQYFQLGAERFGIDTEKWQQFVNLGLVNFAYNRSENDKVVEYYNKLVNFFGADFFTVLATKKAEPTVAKKIDVSNDIYCKGKGYIQQLSLANIEVEQAKQNWFFATLNLKSIDNQENREKEARTKELLNKAINVYEEIYKKCN